MPCATNQKNGKAGKNMCGPRKGQPDKGNCARWIRHTCADMDPSRKTSGVCRRMNLPCTGTVFRSHFRSRSEFKLRPEKELDATVTAKGEAKFAAAKSDDASVRLLLGVDFRRKEREAVDTRVFFDSSAGWELQRGWYLCRRLRPLCPHLAKSPVPSKWGEEPERNAKLTLAYFKAWTLNTQRGNAAVPHLRQLRQADATWEQSLREWLLNLPCEETKRYVGNFLSVYRVRPENEGENSDDEDDKEDLVVTAGDFGRPVTRMFQSRKGT